MVLDPRFILAFILGIILDVLAYIFMGLDAGIIAAAVNIVLGWMIVWLMVQLAKSKGRDGQRVQQRGNEMRQQATDNARLGKGGMQQRKQMTTDLLGKRASKRWLKRSLIMYIGSSIPIINFIPFWTVGVIMLLREK